MEQTIEQLLKDNYKYILKVATKLSFYDMDLRKDLIQEGRIAMLIAYDNYDESRGIPFMKYAGGCIRDSMMRFLTDNSRTIRLPSNIVLATRKGLFIPTPMVSTSSVISTTNNGHNITIEDKLVADEPPMDYTDLNMAIEALPKEMWKDTIKRRYGLLPYSEPQHLREIAKAHGVTKENIRQRLLVIEKRLRIFLSKAPS